MFGEGVGRGILFVGEGPGKEEEKQGRPFVGPSGDILRSVLQRLNFSEYYITNLVCCRSCSPLIDLNTNLPITRVNYKTKLPEPVYKDEPPTPMSVNACAPRFHDEVYIIDPVLIISLGGEATAALTRKACTITSERGREKQISLPGATFQPILTDKKGIWRRKVRGVTVTPVEQSEVQYLLIPTLHPAYVARKLGDKGANSPFRQFVSDIRKGISIYERYVQEVYGSLPGNRAEITDDEIDNYHYETGDHDG